jgi:hypothetical protein
MNTVLALNMNAVAELIGRDVGVAIGVLMIWLKRQQYMKYAPLMAAGGGLAYTIWRFCAR